MSLIQRVVKYTNVAVGTSDRVCGVHAVCDCAVFQKICLFCVRRRLQASNQRVLHLSRESLLSLTSKLVLHEAMQLKERNETGSRVVVRVDAQTTAVRPLWHVS